MSTTDLSSSRSPTMISSSAPLPIPMCSLSPEQNRGCFPGHLSLGEHDSLWVGKVTEDIAWIALTTTDSWGFPLSPTSVQNILAATPNPSPDQFCSIIAGLANTIWIRDNVHWEKVKGLEVELEVLKQRMDNEDNGLAKCPPGYEENKEQLPNFTIPLDDRTEQFACFIKQLDNGRVTGLHSGAKSKEEAQIIDLYASPDYTTDRLMEPLPSWLHCWLWGDHTSYALLKDAVNDLNDWGLLADIHWYRQYDQDITHITQKMELLEADSQNLHKTCHLCEECLITACLADKVKHLSIHTPIGAIQSAWKKKTIIRSAHASPY